jgi:hypothetical protein
VVIPDSVSIVLLATNFNPSIVTKDWLYQNKVVTERVDNFVNTPVFSVVETEAFSIIVDESRLQWQMKKVTIDDLEAACKKLNTIVNLLPHTPYTALGFNFVFNLKKEKCNTNIFYTVNREKIASLTSENFELGVNLLFQFDGFWVMFSVSPRRENVENVRVLFNFHSPTKGTKDIKSGLDKHSELWKKVDMIMEELCLK